MDSPVAKFVNKSLATLWWGIAYGTIIIALLISLLRVALPYLSQHPDLITHWLQQHYHIQVRLTNLQFTWHRTELAIEVDNLTVANEAAQAPLLTVRSIKAQIDLLASIWQRQIIFSNAKIAHLSSHITLPALRQQSNSLPDWSFDGLNHLLTFLSHQPNIQLIQGEVQLHLPNHKTSVLHMSEVSLRNQGKLNQLVGKTELITANNHRGEFDFVIENYQDHFSLSQLNTRIYLASKRLLLTPLLSQFQLPIAIDDGYLTTQIWLHYQLNQWRRLQSHIDLQQVQLRTPNDKQHVIHASANLFADQTANGYRISARNMALQLDKSPQESWQGDIWLDNQFNPIGSDINIPAIELTHVNDWLTAFLPEQFSELALSGRLTKLRLQQAAHQQAALSGHFEHVNVKLPAPYPNAKNLSGDFSIQPDQATVHIDSQNLLLDSKGFFKQPLQADKLQLTMQWQHTNDANRLQVEQLRFHNKDLSLFGELQFTLPHKAAKPPLLGIYAEMRQAHFENASAYLPQAVMPDSLVEYLSQSIIAGDTQLAKLVFHGPVSQFPFDNRSGIFRVESKIEHATFQFAPDWPPLHDATAQLFFKGSRMDIVAGKQTLYNNQHLRTHAYIPNLHSHKPVLKVDAQAQVNTAMTQDFLQQTPLSQIATQLEPLSFQGFADLNLQLDVDLFSPYHTDVNVSVALKGNQVSYQPLNLTLEHAQGAFQINNQGVAGHNLSGTLWSQPATLSFQAGAHDTQIHATSQIDSNGPITQWLASPLWQYVSGTTTANVQLLFNEHGFQADIQSDLNNIRSVLPAPMNKSETELSPLNLTLKGDLHGLHAVRADVQQLFIQLQQLHDAEQTQFNISYPNPITTTHQGGSYIALTLPEVDLGQWLNVIQQAMPDTAQGDHIAFPPLQQFSLSTPSATFKQLTFAPLTLYTDEMQKLHITSPILSGEAYFNADNNTLYATAEHFDYQSSASDNNSDNQAIEEKASSIQPKQLPNIEAQIRRLSIDTITLHNLYLSARSQDNQFFIDKLTSFSDYFSASLSGKWQVINDNQQTTLSGRLSSSDVGGMLKQWQFDSGIKQSPGTMDVNFAWQNSPLNMNLFNMDGQASIVIGAGKMEEIDDKGARVFTLLSLSTLSRRLQLDFSDIFEKGFFYDQISGNFNIKDGQAYSDDLFVDGVAAAVEIKGRTGLISHDVDHHIQVTPKPSASLPILAAWAVNPATGAVVFILDKLFQPAIKVITGLEYRATGPWKNIQLVETAKQEQTVDLQALRQQSQPEAQQSDESQRNSDDNSSSNTTSD